MMNFFIKSRNEIEKGFIPDSYKCALISIADPDKDCPEHSGGYIASLGFRFSDADRHNGPGIVLFDDEMAKEIVEIAYLWYDIGVDTIVVNCEAGMSRSAGVAAALSYAINFTDMDIVRKKPMYNRLVYSTILKHAMEFRNNRYYSEKIS